MLPASRQYPQQVVRCAPNFGGSARRERHRRQQRVLRRQQCAPRPHQRILPRTRPWRQVRAPRGALRPRARHDRRCNPKSPLSELVSPGNFVSHTRGQKQGKKPLQNGCASILLTPPPCRVAAFVVNSEQHTGARPSVRLCVGPKLAHCVHLTELGASVLRVKNRSQCL